MTDLLAFRGRRAILFDLDGTLYDAQTYPAYFEEMDRVTGKRVQEVLGAPSEVEAFARLEARKHDLGLGSKSATLEQVFGIGLAEMNRFREAHTHPERYLRGDPELFNVLEGLALKFALVLGTNNAPGLAKRILHALGIPEQVFIARFSSEDLQAAKPDPKFFEELCVRVRYEPRDFASVGDSESSDLLPARALGMGTYLVKSRRDLYRLAELGRSAT